MECHPKGKGIVFLLPWIKWRKWQFLEAPKLTPKVWGYGLKPFKGFGALIKNGCPYRWKGLGALKQIKITDLKTPIKRDLKICVDFFSSYLLLLNLDGLTCQVCSIFFWSKLKYKYPHIVKFLLLCIFFSYTVCVFTVTRSTMRGSIIADLDSYRLSSELGSMLANRELSW